MPYGKELQGAVDDGHDRGLIGLFLCSSFQHQVYKLTNWIRRNDFSPVHTNPSTQDALVGSRKEPDGDYSFTIPMESGDVIIPKLPDFLRTKGTAFLLLPSKSMLEALTHQP